MKQLHGIDSGSSDEVVVLLHGLFGSASNLGVLAKALEADFRVIRLDLRNHGRSFHADEMSLADMADDVARYLDAHNIASANLLGHSLGGKVAMQLALSDPDRVRRLVVADIAPVVYPRHHDAILDALKSIDLRALKSREQADEVLRSAVDSAGVRQFLLKNLGRGEEGGWAWKMNLAAIDQHYDELRQAPEGSPYAGPVLFIKGDDSDYIQAEHSAVIKRLFPAAAYKIIQGAGHWLHADKPAAFNQLVQRFLTTSG